MPIDVHAHYVPSTVMDATGIDRQLLSTWCDLFGYGLDAAQGAAWHRLLNASLAAFAQRYPDRFSFLASVYLPDAAQAARELEHAVTQLGAVGAIVSANVEGANLGKEEEIHRIAETTPRGLFSRLTS